MRIFLSQTCSPPGVRGRGAEHGKQLWMYGGQGTDAYELNMLSLDTLRWEGTQGTKAPHLAHQPGAVAITHSKIFTFGCACESACVRVCLCTRVCARAWAIFVRVGVLRPCCSKPMLVTWQ